MKRYHHPDDEYIDIIFINMIVIYILGTFVIFYIINIYHPHTFELIFHLNEIIGILLG